MTPFVFYSGATIFFFYILLPWAVKIYLKYTFLKTLRKKGVSCLTFDDGPNPLTTPEILRILADTQVKATFFALGQNIEKYPHLAKRIVDMGHEIGEHSYQHRHAWKTGPFKTFRDLLKGGRIVGHYKAPGHLQLLRPPYGKLNLMSILYALCSWRRIIFWNIDPRDYAQESGDHVADFVNSDLKEGQIILLHDGRYNSPGKEASFKVTIDALPLILEEARNRRVQFKTITEAIEI
jgi:peptidoglycan/xylan/chitin deacetylase (PgdA/CDA1 family)